MIIESLACFFIFRKKNAIPFYLVQQKFIHIPMHTNYKTLFQFQHMQFQQYQIFTSCLS